MLEHTDMNNLQELVELPATERSAALRIRVYRLAEHVAICLFLTHPEKSIQIRCDNMPADDVRSGSLAHVEPFTHARVSVHVRADQTHYDVRIQSGRLDSKSFKLVLKRETMVFCRETCSHKVWLRSVRPLHSLVHQFNLAMLRTLRGLSW